MRPPGSKSTFPTGHTNPYIQEVIYYLDSWLDALGDGSYLAWYPRSDSTGLWSGEDIDRIVAALDEEIDMEATSSPGATVGAAAGPGFSRLPPPQRLALVQGLAAIRAKYPERSVPAVGEPSG